MGLLSRIAMPPTKWLRKIVSSFRIRTRRPTNQGSVTGRTWKVVSSHSPLLGAFNLDSMSGLIRSTAPTELRRFEQYKKAIWKASFSPFRMDPRSDPAEQLELDGIDRRPRTRKKASEWMIALFRKHPNLYKEFVKREYAKRQREKQGPPQTTQQNRLEWVDELVLSLIKQRNLHPNSFLDIGAALQAEDAEHGGKITPAQTSIDSKKYFERNGLSLKVTALDVVPISKEQQRVLLKDGVSAYTQDYISRPPYGTFSIIRMANISIHLTRREFAQAVSNAFKALEPNGLLVIHNRTHIAGQFDMMPDYVNETTVYQKIKKGNAFALEPIYDQPRLK